jgi:hypothetical protein
MPPIDDPLARLHGRAAFAKALNVYFLEAKPELKVEPWPVLGGWELGKIQALGIQLYPGHLKFSFKWVLTLP